MLKPRITARQLIWISAFLLMLTILMMTWSTLRQQESTLAIRAVNRAPVCQTASQFCIIWMRTAFILKALRLKMTCCSLPSIPLRKAPQQKQCLIKRYHTVMSSLSRTMTTKRYSGCPAYGKAHTALANLRESNHITHFGDFIV